MARRGSLVALAWLGLASCTAEGGSGAHRSILDGGATTGSGAAPGGPDGGDSSGGTGGGGGFATGGRPPSDGGDSGATADAAAPRDAAADAHPASDAARDATSDVETSRADGAAPHDAADGGDAPDLHVPACGTSLTSVEPRPSSFASCSDAGYACDFGEACDVVTYDLLCDPSPCTTPPQPGDLRCHRRCTAGGCASGERCESRLAYVSDTPSQYQALCMCDPDAASCAAVPPGSRGPEGGIALFQPQAPLVRDLYAHAMAATGSWLVVSGGLTIESLGASSATLRVMDTVSAAPIDASGSLGTWRDVGSLAAPTTNHAMAVAGDRLYVAGGKVGAGFTTAVASAPIGADGTLGAFRDEAPLPAGRAYHVLLTDGDTLVVAAGSLSAPYFTTGTTDLWTAVVGVDGVVSGWTTVSAPVPVHYDGGATLADGVLYVVGTTGGIHRKSLASLATAGGWAAGAEPLGDDVDFASSGQHALRVVPLCDLLLFLVPGARAVTVERGADGSLGAWHVASRAYDGPGGGFAVAATPAGHVYVTGGFSGFTPIRRVNDVWSTAR